MVTRRLPVGGDTSNLSPHHPLPLLSSPLGRHLQLAALASYAQTVRRHGVGEFRRAVVGSDHAAPPARLFSRARRWPARRRESRPARRAPLARARRRRRATSPIRLP